ncbi:hypothetical protein KSP39_PZI017891 [Platanthera zijinensis]|uniref:Uncharacterized protein n=1 Tax=Platanthera zijinensis TaxID=2320716 RepID=A0AAP0B4V9_9ASPA
MFGAHVLCLLQKYLGEYIEGLFGEAFRVWKGFLRFYLERFEIEDQGNEFVESSYYSQVVSIGIAIQCLEVNNCGIEKGVDECGDGGGRMFITDSAESPISLKVLYLLRKYLGDDIDGFFVAALRALKDSLEKLRKRNYYCSD